MQGGLRDLVVDVVRHVLFRDRGGAHHVVRERVDVYVTEDGAAVEPKELLDVVDEVVGDARGSKSGNI